MSSTELSATIHELRELRRMADELAAEIETLTDTIKEHMAVASTPRHSNATTRNCTASTAAKPFRSGLHWRNPLTTPPECDTIALEVIAVHLLFILLLPLMVLFSAARRFK